MIEKLIKEGELQEIDINAMENAEISGINTGKFSQAFDPENKYTVPYFAG